MPPTQTLFGLVTQATGILMGGYWLPDWCSTFMHQSFPEFCDKNGNLAHNRRFLLQTKRKAADKTLELNNKKQSEMSFRSVMFAALQLLCLSITYRLWTWTPTNDFRVFTAVRHNYSNNGLTAKIQKMTKWIQIYQPQCADMTFWTHLAKRYCFLRGPLQRLTAVKKRNSWLNLGLHSLHVIERPSKANSNENDVLFSKWHRHTRIKKIWVLLSGVEPKTFRLLVWMLYHWATGDSWELRPLCICPHWHSNPSSIPFYSIAQTVMFSI